MLRRVPIILLPRYPRQVNRHHVASIARINAAASTRVNFGGIRHFSHGKPALPPTNAENENQNKESDIDDKSKSQKKSIIQSITTTIKGIATSTIDVIKNPGATWVMIKEVAHHYWVGSKLLWAEINTAIDILGRIKSGHEMTRRERLHLIRTAGDVFRLVPFSIFVIVPFMEFLLPFALKLFPNMLPSTFQDALKKEEDMKKELQMRLALADFLHDTLQTMATKRATTAENEDNKEGTGALKVIDLLEKIKGGEALPNEKVLEIARLFKDELTLPNMARPQLVSLCQYMCLPTFGSDSFLRFQLRNKMKAIKEDDRRILWEGIESLTALELSEACRARGMRAHGMNTVRYQKQLKDWLDLSIQKNVPISLLIMSRAFSLSQSSNLSEDVLKSSISALDKDTINEVVLSVASPVEENLPDMKMRKLESVQFQQELIEDELEESEEAKRIRDAQAAAESAAAIAAAKAVASAAAVTASVNPPLAPEVSESAAISTANAPVSDGKVLTPPVVSDEPEVVNRTLAPGHRGLAEDEEAILHKPAPPIAEVLASAKETAASVAAVANGLPSAAALMAEIAATQQQLNQVQQAQAASGELPVADSEAPKETVVASPVSAPTPAGAEPGSSDADVDLSIYELEAIGDLARTSSVQREKAALTVLQAQLEAVSGELEHPSKTTSASNEQASEAGVPTEQKPKKKKPKGEDKSIANMHSMLSKMIKRLETQIDSTEKAVGAKLHVLDLDEDGQLSAEELRTGILKTLKADISDEDIQELVKILDQDKDGKVSVVELLRYAETMKEKKDLE